MARPLRIEYPGAFYHVMARGLERSTIFRDDRDRVRFLQLVGKVAEDQGWVVHGYCLMGNHYHLFLETPRGRLSEGMRRLNGRYAQWFNFRHERVGHLLQGRFKSVLLEKGSQALELCRYVVLNPVRAGLVARVGDWRWSSYRATAGIEPGPAWLETEWMILQFGRRLKEARPAYVQFVAEGKGLPSPMKQALWQLALGSESFLRSVQGRLEDRELDEDITGRRRMRAAAGLDQIRAAVAKEFGATAKSLSRRRAGEAKMAAIYLARKLSGLTGREIGSAFGVKGAWVSNVVTQIEEGRRPKLRRRLETLGRGLARS
jgi:REP element-mobilizing transposase RayT